jgi:hypothetical protein
VRKLLLIVVVVTPLRLTGIERQEREEVHNAEAV